MEHKSARGGEAMKQSCSLKKLGAQQAAGVGRRREGERSRVEGRFFFFNVFLIMKYFECTENNIIGNHEPLLRLKMLTSLMLAVDLSFFL